MSHLVSIVPNSPYSSCKQLPINPFTPIFDFPHNIYEIRWGTWKEGSFNLVPYHTASAILQLHNACPDDSSNPHILHPPSLPIPRAFRHSFVGNIFLHALQNRCLILFGQFKHQAILQISLIPEPSELPPSSPLLPSIFSTFWATLYALLTVSLPFDVQAHIRHLRCD